MVIIVAVDQLLVVVVVVVQLVAVLELEVNSLSHVVQV